MLKVRKGGADMRNFERAQQKAQDEALKAWHDRLDNEVYILLQEIEGYQESINDKLVRLHTRLGQYPTFEKRWSEFQKLGGVTAEDYYRFVKGRFAPRKVTQRKHLRLVVTNTKSKSKSLPRHRLNPTGDDAA
jgi:hypothetical protein